MIKKAGSEVARAVPPFGVTIGGLCFGLGLHEWVYILTIIYTLLQIIRVIPKVLRSYRPAPEPEE